MTRFFLGSTPGHAKAMEADYLDLRERSFAAVGCVAKPRRIFKIDCRFEGSDCEIEVGRPLPHGGEGRGEFVAPIPRKGPGPGRR